ncbi:DUF3043 domain-containing protein [Nocardioides fonticola]|uniref:DUF3043 domain-containing protein n=1 Tax=Nocardioides fonticola TaxID=450363 RepID=A0ABP7XP07_9ACTN
MFRRSSKSESGATATANPPKPGGKGRPTPTRKEAEAAARAKARVPRTRKEQIAADRARRAEQTRTMREALKTGDERHLPARDRGPVRRFVRDFVDVRFSFVELVIPILLVTLVLTYSGSARLAAFGSTVLLGATLLIVVDMLVLRFRLRRELTRRFPDKPLKGTTYYAITRSLQMKFMRLPKPQVKLGQALPEDYR